MDPDFRRDERLGFARARGARRRAARRSPAAERAEDHQLLIRRDRPGDVLGLVQADEDPHVPADAVLLVDDAEFQSWEAAVEVVQRRLDRLALRLHPRRAFGVGGQLRGNQDGDHQSGAATTE